MKYFFLLLVITTHSFYGQLTLEDIWVDYKFYPKSVAAPQWNSPTSYLELRGKNTLAPNIYQIEVEHSSGEKIILQQHIYEEYLKKEFKKKKGLQLEDFTVNNLLLSPNKEYLLLIIGQQSVYRYSKKSNFILFDIKKQVLKQIILPTKSFYPTFSNTGNQIAFVCENNIWVYSIKNDQSTKLTTDGKLNHIINGKSDWGYEEEFELTRAFEWTQNDQEIVYLQFDESQVKTYDMQLWGATNYPSTYSYKYPKTGEKISRTKVKQVNIETGVSKTIIDFSEDDIYIPRLQVANERVLITKINRTQNHLSIIDLNLENHKKSKNIYTENSDTYIELKTPIIFLKNGFVISNESSGYRHLYYYDYAGRLLKQLTQGNWEVDRVFGSNEKGIYFSSTQKSIFDRPVYRVNLTGKSKLIVNSKGVNEVTLNDATDLLFIENSSIGIPNNYSLIDSEGGFVNNIESNANVYYETQNYTLPSPQYFTYENSNGDILNAYFLKPHNFDSTKNYPVLVHTYGGPGYQSLKNEYSPFDYYWHSLLTEYGVIVAVADVRGTGGKGSQFKTCTYQNLGKIESDDLLEFGEHLKLMPFINDKHMAIWGWSYGGFLSSLTAFKGDTYDIAIAIAPVTNWMYYDAIYTERYMNLPENNKNGYTEGSPIYYANNFTGKLLLAHGTADDNVHIQNSYELQNALIQEGKQFDFALYPDRNHGIYGGNTRLHLYHKMTDFLIKNLNKR